MMLLVWGLIGAGAGTGVWLLTAAVWPARATLAEQITALQPTPNPVAASTPRRGYLDAARRPVVAVLRLAGLPTRATRRHLACLGIDPADHLATQATTTLAGLTAAPIGWALLTAAGAPAAPATGAWVSIAGAAVGGLLPGIRIRAAANRYRAALRDALASLLDLTVISLAGGGGIEQSLHDAASVGTSTPMAAIRDALTAARFTRATPWQGLAHLGHRTGVAELEQLAATIGLAGTEGARIRTSLTARATAMRSRQLTDAEGDAAAATERMSLPVVGLFTGYLLLIGYPAVAAVLNGL